MLEEWKKYSSTLGQQVKVIAPDQTYFGEAVDIDEDGLLMVKREDGRIEKVIAGDVSIRPARPSRGIRVMKDQRDASGRNFCHDDDHQCIYHSSYWACSHYDAAFGRAFGRYASGKPLKRGQHMRVGDARLRGTAVFNQGQGGAVMLVGPTGGFIIAFIITAWLVGYLTERDMEASYLKNLMYMCVGMLVCYAIGSSASSSASSTFCKSP